VPAHTSRSGRCNATRRIIVERRVADPSVLLRLLCTCILNRPADFVEGEVLDGVGEGENLALSWVERGAYTENGSRKHVGDGGV
jgi:hypothetical protein